MKDFYGLRCYGLRLTLRSTKPFPFQDFYGHWLHNLLGQALFRGVCIYSQAQCPECALRGQCAYPQVFNPHLLPNPQHLPSSWILHDWQITSNRQKCQFSLILLAHAVRYAETWIIHLAQYIKELEIEDSGTGWLEQVRDLATKKVLFASGYFIPRATLSPIHFAPITGNNIFVQFLTPFVSQNNHQETFLSSLHTRLQKLINHYGNGKYLPLKTNLWHVNQIHLHDTVSPPGIENPCPIHGQLGTIEVTQVTPEGAKWLAVGQYLHVGKNTNLGYGHFLTKEINHYERRFVVSRWG